MAERAGSANGEPRRRGRPRAAAPDLVGRHLLDRHCDERSRAEAARFPDLIDMCAARHIAALRPVGVVTAPEARMGTVDERDLLTRRFEEHRTHLRTVAYRMLGSSAEADDAVQEAWLRLHRADTGDVANLGAWLTTVVARISLDMLRARSTRHEQPLDGLPEPGGDRPAAPDPEQEALLADSVGPALLVVLETLAPAERLAFVLHDMFAVPFDEIAPIVGRTPAATRQLASRARRRVRGAPAPDSDLTRQRRVVEAFLAASRSGDFAALLAVLDPDVVLRADDTAVAAARGVGAAPVLAPELRGAAAVADAFAGKARGARPALVEGLVGATWAPGGEPRVVLDLTVADGRVVVIEIIADPEALAGLDVALLPA